MAGSLVYVATSETVNRISGDNGLVFKIGKARYCGDGRLTEENRSLNARKMFKDNSTGAQSYGGPLFGATDWEFIKSFHGLSQYEEELHNFLMSVAYVSLPPADILTNDKLWLKKGAPPEAYGEQTKGYTECHVFDLEDIDEFMASDAYHSSGKLVRELLPFIREVVAEPWRIERIIAGKRRAAAARLPGDGGSQ